MQPFRPSELDERVYLAVQQIPHGQVATYGEIATVVGRLDAREVGAALGGLAEARAAEVPWQRVVSREGGISTRGLRQRELLEAEGVSFDEQGHVRMARHQWDGPSPQWAAAHGFTPLPERGERGEQLSLF